MLLWMVGGEKKKKQSSKIIWIRMSFPPEYDYDSLDGTDEEHLKQILLFLLSTSPLPPSRLMVPFLKSDYPLKILDQNTISKFQVINQDNTASQALRTAS